MKTIDKLRAIGVINTHDLLKRFEPNKRLAIACSFLPGHARACQSPRTQVYSPFFKTDPGAHFMDHGCKTFIGNITASMPRAVDWAAAQYGITEWETCPTNRSTKIPKVVRDRALAAVKGVDGPPQLIVYGWSGDRNECPPAANGGKQTREICAAPSKAAAARAAGVERPTQLWNLGSTANAAEVTQALSEPGVVFWRPLTEYPPGNWRRG